MKPNGEIVFLSKEIKDCFFSLNIKQRKEFENDLAYLLRKIIPIAESTNINFFDNNIGQRLSGKYYSVGLGIDLRSDNNIILILKEFKEVTLNQYLDLLSEQKKSEYIKLDLNDQ